MEWKGTTGVILVFSHFFKLLFLLAAMVVDCMSACM